MKYLPLASGFLVLVLSLVVGVLTVTSKSSTQQITTKADFQTASLALSPPGGDYSLNSGATYPVGIIVDSAENEIDGVDIVLKFDPTRVRVEGTKVLTTNLFEQFMSNTIDNSKGEIKLGALTFTAKPVTGIIGTFRYRPLVKGEVKFSFDFTPGSTTDSNIAQHGTAKDVLGKVTNASYTFN